MPNTALDDAIKEAYASAPPNTVIYHTIELYHSLTGHIYMVQQREGMTATLETGEVVDFEPVAFRFKQPEIGDNGINEIPISIDNIDRRISDFLDTVLQSSEKVQMIYRPYLSSDLSTPRMTPPLRMTLSDVVVKVEEVTGRGSFADLVNKVFPDDFYTPSRFPTLNNGV